VSGIVKRITDYLMTGGLHNPELANHDAVRDLLIDARAEVDGLRALKAENAELRKDWERSLPISEESPKLDKDAS
jgi:hypothetical protein